jgi:hypothetical protein
VLARLNPALGLIFGWVAELIRAAIVRRMIPERPKHEASDFLAGWCYLHACGFGSGRWHALCRITDAHD